MDKIINLPGSIYHGRSEEYLTDEDWKNISICEKLSYEFVNKFQDKLNWDMISIYQTLNRKFINKFQDKLNWDYICIYRSLSTNNIREFQDKLNWKLISIHQKLSIDIIREFKDKLDLDYLYLIRNINVPIELLPESVRNIKSNKEYKSEKSVNDYICKISDSRLINIKNEANNNTDIKKSNRIYLMCPHCYRLIDTKVDCNINVSNSSNSIIKVLSSNDYYIRCCVKRITKAIELDYNIGEAISILNKKGYKTKFCCEGHKDNSTAYIYFENDNILKYIDCLPISWYLDLQNFRGSKRKYYITKEPKSIVIRSDFCNHDEAMLDILEFANNLPNIIS